MTLKSIENIRLTCPLLYKIESLINSTARGTSYKIIIKAFMIKKAIEKNIQINREKLQCLKNY